MWQKVITFWTSCRLLSNFGREKVEGLPELQYVCTSGWKPCTLTHDCPPPPTLGSGSPLHTLILSSQRLQRQRHSFFIVSIYQINYIFRVEAYLQVDKVKYLPNTLDCNDIRFLSTRNHRVEVDSIIMGLLGDTRMIFMPLSEAGVHYNWKRQFTFLLISHYIKVNAWAIIYSSP